MHLLNRLVVAAIPAVPKPIVRYFAGRYIAGETVEDAIATVRALNAEGVCATLDVLGEDITRRDEAIASREQSNQSFIRSPGKDSTRISPSSSRLSA